LLDEAGIQCALWRPLRARNLDVLFGQELAFRIKANQMGGVKGQ
jgi:hypothetical protein